MQLKFRIIFLLILPLTYACERLSRFSWERQNEEALARVGEETLLIDYFKDYAFPDNAADSILLLKSMVDSWVREQIMLQAAEERLDPEEVRQLEDRLKSYRKSLLLHSFQDKMIATRIDTHITREAISQYFAENEDDFQLKYNIVQLSFVVLAKGHRDLPKVRNWFKSEKPAEQEKLIEFCRRHAFRFSLFDSSWVRMDDVEKEFPLTYVSQEMFLRNHRYVELEDEEKSYLIHVLAYKTKESLSPLEFEIPKIRLILLNQRKQEGLRKLENELYEDAILRNTVFISVD
jgi:hypothetical protein